MSSKPLKVLLIRFSSFGDVTQCLSVPSRLKELGPSVEIHWVTRLDFVSLIETHPAVKHVWALDKKQGLPGLFRLILQLRRENFTHIYDAHNNLRSRLVRWGLFSFFTHTLIKSQKRWKRFLLFRFRRNTFEQPFSGQRDLLEPLQKWGLQKTLPPVPQIFLPEKKAEILNLLPPDFRRDSYITLAASAAYPLKRWPLDSWKELIRRSEQKFVLLGGPEDQFLQELVQVAPERVFSLAGKATLEESGVVVKHSRLLIANDTGIMHVAEQLGHPCLALMGPAPFGFPSRPSTEILQLDLPCRPCSKHGQGPCVNPQFQECLAGISATHVLQKMRQRLADV